MIVSISEASRLSGRSRQTLYDMRDRGQLSMTTDATTGKPGIDMAELCRVFPRVKPDGSGQKSVESSGRDLTTEKDSPLVSALQANIDALERLLAEKDQRIALLEDLRAGRPTETVAATPEPTPVPAPIPVPRKPRGLLDRLVDGLQEALR